MTEPAVPVDGGLVEPGQVERWCEYVAERVAPAEPPKPGEIKTPDSIIFDLDMLGHLAAQNVRILREADRSRRAAKRVHAAAVLRERKVAEGTVDDRKAAAEVGAMTEWEAADNAELAYEYAKQMGQLVRDRTSAVQTQSKQVELTYQLAGTGRG